MADRYSNPSGGLGIDRFHVWPLGSDSYNHVDNAANWDLADAIIGIPASGNWPPTTGINGGIYGEVKRLQNDRVPIGTIISWFRPNHSTAIPDTWHVCDGTTLTSSFHDFPGGGSVTLPDLRNKFILGADDTLSNGTAAAVITSGNIDTAAGAPGAQATDGSNKIVQTTSQMPSHTHAFTGNALATHRHYTMEEFIFGNNTKIKSSTSFQGGGSKPGIADLGGISGSTDNSGFTTDAVTSLDSAGTPSGSNSTTGSGNPMDNRPNWIGLIFLVKVLYSTTP